MDGGRWPAPSATRHSWHTLESQKTFGTTSAVLKHCPQHTSHRPFQPLMNTHLIPPYLYKCKHSYIRLNLKGSTYTPYTFTYALLQLRHTVITITHPTSYIPNHPHTNSPLLQVYHPNTHTDILRPPPAQRYTFTDTHTHPHPGREYRHSSLLSPHPQQTGGSRRARSTPTACAHVPPGHSITTNSVDAH